MGKRRKTIATPAPSGPRNYDPVDARLGPVRTFEDVANSEDEFFADQDQISFNDASRSKKRKAEDDLEEFLEASDEEVLGNGYDESDEEQNAELERLKQLQKKNKRRGRAAAAEDDDEDEARQEEEELDEGWTGATRKEYYNADTIETDADALEEEVEAKRLQAKKLAQMDQADFVFDEDEWRNVAGEEQTTNGDGIVIEQLKDVEVAEDATPEERYKVLQARYPEFEYLVEEFENLQPLLAQLSREALGKPARSIEVVKFWVLGCYVASLASYFAILTSSSETSTGSVIALPPSALREHEIMQTLVRCREAWQRLKDRRSRVIRGDVNGDASSCSETPASAPEVRPALPVTKTTAKRRKKLTKHEKARAQAVEDSLAGLDELLKPIRKSKFGKITRVRAAADDDSDFGEEDGLDARTAADKAARKKSLKFYTSQIVQKATKRNDAGRDAGGDMDIPYRERFRDREARLNAAAQKRGQKLDAASAPNAAQAGDDDDDTMLATQMRNGEDDYYDMVANRSKARQEAKAERKVVAAKTGALDRIVEDEEIGKDGKRKITYHIEKNKGLAPRRKKEVRNPRVKKRMRYEAKKKKLGSMRPVYKGGEGRGGYQGEKSGIKTGLVKSTRL